jgi:hypothetical protein
MCKMIDLDYEVYESDDASKASETNTVATVASATSTNGDSEQNSRSVDAPPGPFDVLFGRGRPFNDHPGNDRMRKIVEAYKARYAAAEKQEKTLITQEVVQIIKNSGKQNGRFLKQQSKGKDAPWFEVSTKEAHKKVGHRLREEKTKSAIQLVIAKREQQVIQPHLESIANDLEGSSPLLDEERGPSYVEATTVQSSPLEEKSGWGESASLTAGPPFINPQEQDSRKTEELLLPLSANFPRYHHSSEDHEDEEEETETDENLDGDEQESDDPLDLSLADASQLSNEQANYLLTSLEHLEIEGRQPIIVVAAAAFESAACHPSDENVQVTDHCQPIPESLEGQFISCGAQTVDGELMDDFFSRIDDNEDFFFVVDEVAQQMLDNDEQQQHSSDQLPLLEPTKEAAKLLPTHE